MTILIDPDKAASLSLAGTSNNPILAHDNLAKDATITTEVGTEVQSTAYAVTGTTYDAWIATPSGANRASLQFVFASPVTLNFVAIAAHNLATVGAAVRLQYSTDSGSTWTNSGAGLATPTDNRAIGFYFEDETSDYWRLFITDATGDVAAAVVMLTNAIVVPQRIYAGYAPPITPTNVTLSTNRSEGGHLLGSSVVRTGSSMATTIEHVDPTFIRGDTWKAFQVAYNGGEGVFWAWRPTKYGDLFYGWSAGNPVVPVNMGITDLMSFDLEMNLYDDT